MRLRARHSPLTSMAEVKPEMTDRHWPSEAASGEASVDVKTSLRNPKKFCHCTGDLQHDLGTWAKGTVGSLGMKDAEPLLSV